MTHEVIWKENGHERVKSFNDLADAIEHASKVNEEVGVVATIYSRGALARVGTWLQELDAIGGAA